MKVGHCWKILLLVRSVISARWEIWVAAQPNWEIFRIFTNTTKKKYLEKNNKEEEVEQAENWTCFRTDDETDDALGPEDIESWLLIKGDNWLKIVNPPIHPLNFTDFIRFGTFTVNLLEIFDKKGVKYAVKTLIFNVWDHPTLPTHIWVNYPLDNVQNLPGFFCFFFLGGGQVLLRKNYDFGGLPLFRFPNLLLWRESD